MLQLIGAIVLIIAVKLAYDLCKDLKKRHQRQRPKGGEVIDLSDNWIDMNHMPYRRRDPLLNARERVVFDTVVNIMNDSLYAVFPKVRLVDFLMLAADARNRQEYYERVKEKSVDFLICRLPDLTPVLVVQVEPPASDAKRKQRAERFLRNALQAAGIGFLSVNPNQLPEAQEVHRLLDAQESQA